MNDSLNTIVEGRVFDGKLFATNRDRGLYIGTLVRNRPQWLKENDGRWRYIKDIQREAPKDGGDGNDILLVDTPADASSPPSQSESMPATMNESVPSGSTQTELPRSSEAAKREINEFETDTTPLDETERKQGRAGRQRKKRKSSAKVLKTRRKRMLAVLDYLKEKPILSGAARKAGIHRKTLEKMRKRSEAGDDRFDFEEDGLMWRFHELVEFAIEEAHDKIFEEAWKIGMGGVVYKYDERLLSLGLEGADAYLRDENGIPVVDTVRKPNGKMLRWLLERLRPEVYGKHPKLDVPQQGGVILIDASKEPKKTCPPASIKARSWKAFSRKLRQAKN